jgi:hypothetical protein
MNMKGTGDSEYTIVVEKQLVPIPRDMPIDDYSLTVTNRIRGGIR